MGEREEMWQEDNAGGGLDLEELDLEVLRNRVKACFGDRPPMGYVPGKTLIRQAVVQLLGCSDVQAENLVDTLESRHLIHYEGTSEKGIDDLEHAWRFRNGD